MNADRNIGVIIYANESKYAIAALFVPKNALLIEFWLSILFFVPFIS